MYFLTSMFVSKQLLPTHFVIKLISTGYGLAVDESKPRSLKSILFFLAVTDLLCHPQPVVCNLEELASESCSALLCLLGAL